MGELISTRSYRQRYYDKYLFLRGDQKGLELKDYQEGADLFWAHIKNWLPTDRKTPILDMGCGDGKFLFMLKQRGYTDLTGVDLSSEQIEMARQWCSGARVIMGDVGEFLRENPEKFGLITGFDVIEHFRKEELLPLLSLINGALISGGRVILQTPNAVSPWVGTVAYGDITHEWFFTPQGLAKILNLQGFTKFEARACEPHIHGLKSLIRAGLWQLVKASYALVNFIETGGGYGGIYTRVFLATAMKP
jgi:SAM-dependent methyltransferase